MIMSTCWENTDYSNEDVAEAWDGPEGGEVSEATLEKEALDVSRRYVELIAKCRRHEVLVKGSDLVPMSSMEREKIEPVWRDNFESLNTESTAQFSFTDVGFKAICMCMYMEDTCLRLDANKKTWIAMVFARLVIVSCQHTIESRIYWPTEHEFASLMRLVAGVITEYFDHGPAHRAKLIKELENPEFTFEPLPPEVVKQYTARKTPPSLLKALEEQKHKAEEARKKGDKDVKDEVSEEGEGAIWRNTPTELVRNMVTRAARVCYKVGFDNALVKRYPWKWSAPDFRDGIYAQAEVWVIDRLAMDQTEEMTELFRNLTNEWFLPMGSETTRFRTRATASDVVNQLQMLEAEIGVNLGQHLHDQTLRPVLELAKREDKLFWDALFLALFDYNMKQRLRLEWRTEYFCRDPQTPAARARMRSPIYKCTDEKRPMVVFAQRRYWLFIDEEMRPCKSLLHAILGWLRIVQSEFKHILENGEDVQSVHDAFLILKPVEKK